MTRQTSINFLWCTLAIAIPIAAIVVHQYFPAWRAVEQVALDEEGLVFPASLRPFLKTTITEPDQFAPRITNVQILDFDGDGLNDVLSCDALNNSVNLHRQTKTGQWEHRELASDLVAPAHATVVDIDRDGDNDLVVSVLGNIFPDDGFVGSLVLLENDNGRFTKKKLLDDVQRISDAQPADFDGDGDWDLAVAVFGYARGSILWLENLGDGVFRDHQLFSAPGTIHVPVADYDGDGDLDIAAVVSQEEEEVWAFENLGSGKFQPRQLFMTFNHNIGSAGLVKSDLDGDGDMDLILPVGDDLEDQFATPQPFHGCFWLENQGNWQFKAQSIARFGGTYAADCADLDGDGDQDVVLVSMLNAVSHERGASLIWLENDGRQSFRPWMISGTPTQLVTVACGDLNGDGQADLVAGRLNVMHPRNPTDGITAWLNGVK